MKWTRKSSLHSPGDTRKVKRFLLFPKEIKGNVRWLCVATILQKYSANYADSGWEDECFIN